MDSTPTQATSSHGQLRRRGILAGTAALVAGVMARVAERPAMAASGGGADGNMVLGSNTSNLANTSSTTTELQATGSLVINGISQGAFKVTNSNGVGIRAQGSGPLASMLGTSSDGTGVYGISANRIGVFGTNSTGVITLPTGAIGVAGLSTSGTGVRGESGSGAGVHGVCPAGHGVFGQTSAPAGTVVSGMLAAGLAGRTRGTIALYGYSDGPPYEAYAPVGTVGQCENGFGVWGLSSAGPLAVSRPGGGTPTAVSGVLGTSTNGIGVYTISSGNYSLVADARGPNTVALFVRANGSSPSAVFQGNVEISGHLTVAGGINGPVSAQRDSSGAHSATPSLQSVQSPAALIEDIGEGRLVGGQAEVRFDAALVALLPDEQYHVVLTEYDDNNGLYVTGRPPGLHRASEGIPDGERRVQLPRRGPVAHRAGGCRCVAATRADDPGATRRAHAAGGPGDAANRTSP
jgi:hypothetical protein